MTKSLILSTTVVKILGTIFAKCMPLCRNVNESLGHKNCKRLAVIPSLDDTFVMGEFSILFPLLIKCIGLNLHNAHKGPKTGLHNCHPFHIIPLGPMDLVFLPLFWLPPERESGAQFIIKFLLGNQ